MKLIIQILFVLLLVVVGLRTDKGQDLISPYESKVKSILGPQISKYIFQEKEDSGVTIPPLPEIKRDAKNTAIYEKKEQTVEMDEDQRMRLDVAFASELGTVIKRKKSDSSEINSWVNVLSQGGSREGVYRSIVLGDEYYQMENFDEKTKERTSEFAQYILENFVGLTINLETLQKMNFYATKRMVVEKLLEIIEAYETNELVCQWYAALSQGLATRYQQVFTRNIRMDQMGKRHLYWANKAPTQHLKGEVIIKVHLIFNALQEQI